MLDVLIVDDSEDDYVVTADLLSDTHDLALQLNWIDSYDPALEQMVEAPPDLCLLDYRLGDHTGLELLEAVRAQEIAVPVIMLTGEHSTGLDEQAMSCGATDYLVKDELRGDMLERAIRYSLERHRLMNSLARMTMVDRLTGLANRALFDKQVDAAVSSAARYRRTTALLYLDLSGFRQTSERYGHAAGDRLLTTIAHRLRSRMRNEDLVARLGSDEFALLLPEVDHPGNVARVAEKVLEAVAEPVDLGKTRVRCGASIGIATSHGELAGDMLLKAADAARREVQRSGSDGYRFHDADLHAAALERARLESDLASAPDRGELRVHYQPQVDLRDRTVNGVEALLRWQHPIRGLLGPGAFMAVAEESGVVEQLGEWALARACSDYRELRARLPDLKWVAVNVSPRQLTRGSTFVDRVLDVLAASGMPPGALELELGGTIGTRERRGVRATLQALADCGVRVAMDNFGTGSSTLALLRELPVRTIKLEQSITQGIDSSKSEESFVRAIVAVARALDLTLIAEGVETERQAAYLGGLGCHRLQGFLYGSAVALDALEPPQL